MSSPKVRVLLDQLSQPSRAVLIFCRAAGIPHEYVQTLIKEQAHRAPEFTALQPFQTVPLVVDGDFPIRDSNAAVKYLARKFDVADHWYPKDPVGQARVDEYLHWQHLNIRVHGSMYFRKLFLASVLKTGKPSDDAELEKKLRKNLAKELDKIEKVFLKGGENKYIAGTDGVSVADLFACCELEQPLMAGLDVGEGRPLLADYMARVRSDTQPHYDDVHVPLYKMAKKYYNKSRL